MKHATKQTRPRRPVRRASAELNDLRRNLRDELRASETALVAARLRALNERRSQEGVARLRADLEAMHDLGIIDERGRRIRKDLPAEMLEGAADVV